MDWKTASSYYETRLDDALNVCRHAINLASLPQANVPNKLKEILLQEAEPARRQLKRLEKREFRIAVVGLEKAGKSTFVNAWLECDLLPAKAARCTFTTTQIYSVTDDADQKLEVQAKTDQQFDDLIGELKNANAQEDLNTIRQNEATLNQVREDGDLKLPFTRLEDIKEPLRKYVADEKYAHAVLEARLFTSKLAQAEGIVFYDVPGLDSGLAKHVDEAQQMLSDCDAVILVQRFTNLREKELEIIKFTELGDKNVSVADKLFVFLSRIDSQATPEALKKHIEEASEDWLKRAKLPSKRIVSGSAGAYLILNGLAEKSTQLEIGSIEAVENKLQMLTGIEERSLLTQNGTGIPEIKERITQYINTERVGVLSKRCESHISTILDTSKEIFSLVKKKYSENPEDAKRLEEENQRIAFTKWWSKEWNQKKAELQNFFDTSVMNKGSNSSNSVDKFKERYVLVVEDEMQKLTEKTLSKKDTIFAANSNPSFDSRKANDRWREDLFIDVNETLFSIASQLAIELQDEALTLVNYMTDLLWGSERVKEILIENSDDDYLLKLENSLSVLFLRFARPVAEALIRGPVNSEMRDNMIKSLGADIEIVDNYYSGDEAAFSVLKRYAKYGYDLLFNPQLRQNILGIEKTRIKNAEEESKRNVDISEKTNSPQDAVVFEVENDINAFEEYLQYAIFDAAGFRSYCIQELQSLIDKFRHEEGWTGVALNEWYKENSSLLSVLPANLKPQELNLEVSERLRQLRIALEKAQTN